MNELLRFLGSAVFAALLAAGLTLYVFGLPMAAAVQTAGIAAAVVVVITYLNRRRGDDPVEPRHNQG